MPRFLRKTSLAYMAACMATPLVAPALAVNAAAETPKPTGVWLMWVITVVIAGGMAAITFKNAKRTHQD